MEKLPSSPPRFKLQTGPSKAQIKASTVEAVFDDFVVSDLHEIIVRSGVYLPDPG